MIGVVLCPRPTPARCRSSKPGAARSELNLINLANLYRAMETTKGDMRMPRLAPDFDKLMRKALVLS
ncbi:MAG: hypothetical protein U1E55_02665 [Paracoccus sp. (in: a-proteobacteria)]